MILSDLFRNNSLLLLDGGFATLLEQKGVELNSKLWSAEAIKSNVSLVEECHLDYIKSGSDIITTSCTYQASEEGFRDYFDSLPSEEIESLLKECIMVTVRSRNEFYKTNTTRRVQIAISIGPYGAVLADGSEYSGFYRNTVTKKTLKEFHKQRIRLFLRFIAEEEVEDIIILVETIPCIIEVEALLEVLLLEDCRKLPVLLSMTGNQTQKHKMASGEEIIRLCEVINRICRNEKILFPAHASLLYAIGFNCTPPNMISSLLKEVGKHIENRLTLMCYPNSGEVWTEDKIWGSQAEFSELERVGNKANSYSLADGVPLWYQAGARIIGGCCRTYPKDISQLAKVRLSLQKH